MRRGVIGPVLLLMAAALLALEAAAVMARFAMFSGASTAVPVSRWQSGDVLRLAGAVLCALAGWRLLRGPSPPDGR